MRIRKTWLLLGLSAVAASAQTFLFQQYDTATATFSFLRHGGIQTSGPHGDMFSTGPMHSSPSSGYPFVMLDSARNLVLLHPGSAAAVKVGAVISVTVPAAALYDVSGAFARANNASNGGDGVRVVALANNNMGAPLFDATISSNNAVNTNSMFTGAGVARFHFGVSLAKGDVIQFAVFSGPNMLDDAFDLTALEVTIMSGGVTIDLPRDFPSAQAIETGIPLPAVLGDVDVNASTNRVYVGGNIANVVQGIVWIDGNTGQTVKSIGPGQGVRVNSATNKVYAADLYGGHILVYSGADGSLLRTISTFGCPVAVAVDSSQNRIWGGAQCGSSNDPVFLIDGSTDTLISGRLGSGGVVGTVMAVNPVTHVLYVWVDGAVEKKVDPSSFAVTNAPFSAALAAVNPQTNRMYGANAVGKDVLVFDAATESLVATLAVSKTGAIAVNPTRNRVYAVDRSLSPQAIRVFDGATNTQIGTIPLGSGDDACCGMAVNANTGQIYLPVTRSSSQFLLVIDDALSSVRFIKQRVSTQAPSGTVCSLPPSVSAFLTTDATVYLYFEATVTASDALVSDWLAPDGAVLAGYSWQTLSGNFCFTRANLSITGLPANRLGAWQARVYDNRVLLFSAPFTVGAPSNPAPILDSLSPSSAEAAAGGFTLTVKGAGFVAGSVVRWNGTAAPTTFVSATQLSAAIAAGSIGSSGTAAVTVFNPAPGGGASNGATFTILPSSTGPWIGAGGIVSGANFAGGPAAGSIITIFGGNLATGVAQPGGPGPLPTTLGGTRVEFNGVAAPLFYVSPTQIVAQVPWEVAGASALSAQVTVNGVASSSMALTGVAAAPAIFTLDQSGGGQGVAVLSTGEISAPSGSYPFSTRPAKPGDFITLYATGLGPVTNTPASGSPAPASPLSWTTTVPLVTIGGAPAAVTFSGLTPGFVGLYQVNVMVPPNLPAGDELSLQLSIAGTASSPVTVAGQTAATLQNVNVVALGPGSGTITSSPPGINCGYVCSADFPAGTRVTLNVTPNSGSTFHYWSGDCSGAGGCAVTVSGATSSNLLGSLPPRAIWSPFLLYANLGLATPPGSAPGPRINFVPPQLPNGQVGVPYLFATCNPAPVPLDRGLCVPSLEPSQVTNPSGGSPPYHFQLGTFGGFPPMGISLLLNGTLRGIPQAPGIYRFDLCPVDLQGDYDAGACDPQLQVDGAGNTIFVTVGGTGSGVVTSTNPQETPPRIQCPGGRCREVFPAPGNVTLTANAAAGSHFAGWGGACAVAGTAPDCVLALAPPHGTVRGVTATFNVGNTLTVQVVGQGSVTSTPPGISCPGTCSAVFPVNRQVQLAAAVAPGWNFQGWSGDASGSDSPTTVTLSASRNVVATFTQPTAVTHRLVVMYANTGSGGGTISGASPDCTTSCTVDFTAGTKVTLTATPNSVSLFAGWSGDCTGTSPTCTVTMDRDRRVTATFSRPALNVSKTGTGSGTVRASDGSIACGGTCLATYNANASVTLTATADAGSTFTGWSGAGSGTGTLTLKMTGDMTVTASFALASSGGSYSGTISGSTTQSLDVSCTYNHTVSGRLNVFVNGGGTPANPYTGTFALVNGQDNVTLTSGSKSWCPAGQGVVGVSISGTVGGTSGSVQFSGTTMVLGYVVSLTFSGGTLNANNLTGQVTVASDAFDRPIVQTATLNKN